MLLGAAMVESGERLVAVLVWVKNSHRPVTRRHLNLLEKRRSGVGTLNPAFCFSLFLPCQLSYYVYKLFLLPQKATRHLQFPAWAWGSLQPASCRYRTSLHKVSVTASQQGLVNV